MIDAAHTGALSVNAMQPPSTRTDNAIPSSTGGSGTTNIPMMAPTTIIPGKANQATQAIQPPRAQLASDRMERAPRNPRSMAASDSRHSGLALQGTGTQPQTADARPGADRR